MAFRDLRGILKYVPQFRGQTFVLAIDGEVIGSGRMPTLALDLALLHSLNVRIVLVYGAGSQIGAEGEMVGVEPSCLDGRGVTDEATLRLASSVVSRVGSEISGALSAAGVRAAVPNAISAYAAGVVDGEDLGLTGRVDRVDGEALTLLLEQEVIPLLGPLAFGGGGESFLLNHEWLAIEVGMALEASKVLFLGGAAPDLPGPHPTRQLAVAEARELAKGGGPEVSRALSWQLKVASRGCGGGIARCHLLDGMQDEALLAELFSNEGVGLMVHSDEYLQVRDATHADIPGMIEMMAPSVEDGELLPRTPEELAAKLNDFVVVEVDGNIIACVAMHDHGEGLAELACLFVKRAHEGLGYGKQLVSYVEREAEAAGMARLVTLSTGAYHYFEKRGYERDDDFPLPQDRAEAAKNSRRNAVVLLKNL